MQYINGEPNDRHILSVIDRTFCVQHPAAMGVPCWEIGTDAGDFLLGVCDKRARDAGMNGKISDLSMNRKPNGKSASEPKRNLTRAKKKSIGHKNFQKSRPSRSITN